MNNVEKRRLDAVLQKVTDFMADHCVTIERGNAVIELDGQIDDVLDLIRCKFGGADTEAMAIRWMAHDWATESEHQLMSPDEVVVTEAEFIEAFTWWNGSAEDEAPI